MNKSELIAQLNKAFQNPAFRLKEKTGLSRTYIWKWLNTPERTSEKLEEASKELIEQAHLSNKATATIGEPLSL